MRLTKKGAIEATKRIFLYMAQNGYRNMVSAQRQLSMGGDLPVCQYADQEKGDSFGSCHYCPIKRWGYGTGERILCAVDTRSIMRDLYDHDKDPKVAATALCKLMDDRSRQYFIKDGKRVYN